MFMFTLVRQQIALVLAFIAYSQTNQSQYNCSEQSNLSVEFLQIPLMFGGGNSCGNSIHHAATYSFWRLQIIIGYILLHLVANTTNNNIILQIYRKYFSLEKLKQIYIGYLISFMVFQVIIVVKTQVESHFQSNNILNTTLDGSSFNAGCLSAAIFFGQYPMKNIEQMRIRQLVNKYIPKGLLGSVCFYSLFSIQHVISRNINIQAKYFVITYFFGRIILYFTLHFATALILCGVKVSQISVITKISSYGQQYLLFSEVLIIAMKDMIGDIKIGPENSIVVILVAAGVLSILIKCIQFFDYVLRDLHDALVYI
ncbi:Hypothetical_protein [Hexamita inflata]|uniref:Hypothetical_protein n=1 Tax=Hexamita inflata TaxID=28002 RepID=A0AA86NNX8_9EUKA|nr:Hypothetical protein HINF_LOCUS11110 [Hexamita inflata]